MKAATLFSGIGAPEQAMPSWEWLWHAEVEAFPNAVMAARHPRSPNLGDVTADDFAERALAAGRPDVLVFGSPCQSFSVAGRRRGLDDPRGDLALLALGVVGRLRPRWFVFENVAGLLSVDDGTGFGILLRAVDGLGYSACWAVLDAQHFGVAQRRQRVFLVGHSGDWRGPAAVLLEPESVRGDHPPGRKARQEVAGSLGAGSERSGGRVGRREAAANHLIAASLRATSSPRGHGHSDGLRGDGSDNLVAFNNTGQGWWDEADSAQSVRKGDDAGGGGARESTLVASTLWSGHQQGHETTLVAFGGNDTRGAIDVATAVNAHPGGSRLDFESETFVAFDCKAGGNTGFAVGEKAGALRGDGHGGGHAAVLAFSAKDHGADASEDLAPTLRGMSEVDGNDGRGYDRSPHFSEELSPAVNTVKQPAVAIDLRNGAASDGATQTLQAAGIGTERGGNPNAIPHTFAGSAVRRLMPVECERLQGFPDGYTEIDYRGKPAADGPRYKALGNSMAVPVVRWILSRVEFVDGLLGGMGRFSRSAKKDG